VGCLERGSCLLASPPGVGAPLLELYASAARPRDKASRRPLRCRTAWGIHPVRTSRAGKPCWQAVLASRAGKACWQAVLASRAGKPCWQAVLASRAGKPCWHAVRVAVGYAAKLRCRTALGIPCGQAVLAIRAGMPSWPTCEGTVYMD
jgi:hypothetical protein